MIQCQALEDQKPKKIASNRSKLALAAERVSIEPTIGLVTTRVSAEPDPLLLTVVQSLGVVIADFFASGHLVPGTTSSRVKKIFQG